MKMDVSEFRVENYKSIQDSGFLEVGGFTTLIGKNDANKSSYLEALTIFLERDKPDSNHFHKQEEEEMVLTAKIEEVPDDISEALGEDIKETGVDQLEIKRVFQRREGTTPKDDTFVNDVKFSKGTIIDDGERLTKTDSRNYIWNHFPNPIFVPAERDVTEETKLKGGTFLNDILVPILEQGGLEGGSEIEEARQTLEEKLSDTSDALGDKLANNMKDHMPDLEDVSLKTGEVSIEKAISPKIKLQDKYLPDSVEIKERGSGIGSLFILSLMQTYVDLQMGEGYYLLFEEPGNWLHPGAERKMLGTLKDISDEGAKILISTHSQVFIDQENRGDMYLVRRKDGESEYEKMVLLKHPESYGSGAEAVIDIFDGTFEGEFAELAVPAAAG